MQEFLNKLYNYEYFGIYLIISIVVLILLFIIILFLGKKDQKEREKTATLKLQQINNEAFKEESVIQPVEIQNNLQPNLENDTIIVPNIGDIANNIETNDEIPEPVLPQADVNVEPEVKEMPINQLVVENPIPTLNVEIPSDEPNIAEVQPTVEVKEENEFTPILEKVEEKPLIFNEPNDDFIVPKIEVVSESAKPVEPEVTNEEVEVPTFNFDEIIKGVEETKKEQTYTQGPQIFSSVYVPQKEELKEPEAAVEEVKETYTSDLDFELPTLKKETINESNPVEDIKEEKIEMPVLNDYNLDSIMGETYNINK